MISITHCVWEESILFFKELEMEKSRTLKITTITQFLFLSRQIVSLHILISQKICSSSVWRNQLNSFHLSSQSSVCSVNESFSWSKNPFLLNEEITRKHINQTNKPYEISILDSHFIGWRSHHLSQNHSRYHSPNKIR